ncbi:hypothetical protein OH76DRAFT_1413436 [Lentinus brumalis]|uniref:Uncharacterized protein n=1 Tax=Lentinus brumalis TaxID=2498619 RepID=A0A371CH49_9APHY|nr:hypothetical protein OH76DRAFT_1413436 [Polyporus brumalis]
MPASQPLLYVRSSISPYASVQSVSGSIPTVSAHCMFASTYHVLTEIVAQTARTCDRNSLSTSRRHTRIGHALGSGVVQLAVDNARSDAIPNGVLEFQLSEARLSPLAAACSRHVPARPLATRRVASPFCSSRPRALINAPVHVLGTCFCAAAMCRRVSQSQTVSRRLLAGSQARSRPNGGAGRQAPPLCGSQPWLRQPANPPSPPEAASVPCTS